jgi:hypothetical protein
LLGPSLSARTDAAAAAGNLLGHGTSQDRNGARSRAQAAAIRFKFKREAVIPVVRRPPCPGRGRPATGFRRGLRSAWPALTRSLDTAYSRVCPRSVTDPRKVCFAAAWWRMTYVRVGWNLFLSASERHSCVGQVLARKISVDGGRPHRVSWGSVRHSPTPAMPAAHPAATSRIPL